MLLLRSLEKTLLRKNTTGKSLASFKVWVNGKLVYHFKGRTIPPNSAAIHQLGIYRSAAISSGEANHIVYYDEINYAKSCKKLKLKKLGYSCKDLKSQKLEKIHTIKWKNLSYKLWENLFETPKTEYDVALEELGENSSEKKYYW